MFSFGLGRAAGLSAAAAKEAPSPDNNNSSSSSKERAVYAMFHESLDALLLEAIKHTSLSALRDAVHATRAHNYAPLDLFHTFVLACDLFSRRANGRAMLLQSLSNISRLSSLNMVPITNSVAQMTCDLVRRLALRPSPHDHHNTRSDAAVRQANAKEEQSEEGSSERGGTQAALPLIHDEELLLRLLQLISSLLSVWPLTSTALAELLGMLVLLFISSTPSSLVEVTCRATLSQCTTMLAAVLHADLAHGDDAATFTSQLHAVAYVRDLCRMASGRKPRWLRVTIAPRDTVSSTNTTGGGGNVLPHETTASRTQSAPLMKAGLGVGSQGSHVSTVSAPTQSISGQTTSNQLTNNTTTVTTTVVNNNTRGVHDTPESRAAEEDVTAATAVSEPIIASTNLLCTVPIPYRLRVFLYDLLHTLWTELKPSACNTSNNSAMASSVSPMVVQCLNEDILAVATQAKASWCDADADRAAAMPTEVARARLAAQHGKAHGSARRMVSSSSFASSSTAAGTTTYPSASPPRYSEQLRPPQHHDSARKELYDRGEMDGQSGQQRRRRRRAQRCLAAAEERHLYYLGQRLAITVVRLFAQEVRSAAASLFIHHTMLLKELGMNMDEAKAGLLAGPSNALRDGDDHDDEDDNNNSNNSEGTSELRGGTSSPRAATMIVELWRHALDEEEDDKDNGDSTLHTLLTLHSSHAGDPSAHTLEDQVGRDMMHDGRYGGVGGNDQTGSRYAATTTTQAAESRLSASALVASGEGSPFLLASPSTAAVANASVSSASSAATASVPPPASRRAVSHERQAFVTHVEPFVLPEENSRGGGGGEDTSHALRPPAPPVASSFLGVVYQCGQLLAQLLLAQDMAATPYSTAAEAGAAMSVSESETTSESAEAQQAMAGPARSHQSPSTHASQQQPQQPQGADGEEGGGGVARHTSAEDTQRERGGGRARSAAEQGSATRRAATATRAVPRSTQYVVLEECVQSCAAFLASFARHLLQLAYRTATDTSSQTASLLSASQLREVLYSLHAPWIACIQRATQPSYFSLAHEATLQVLLVSVEHLVRACALLGLAQLRDEYLQVLCAALYAVDGSTRELLAMCGGGGGGSAAGSSGNAVATASKAWTSESTTQLQQAQQHHLLRRLGDNLSSNVQRLSQSVQDVFAAEGAGRTGAPRPTAVSAAAAAGHPLRYPLAREQQLSARGVLAGFVWKVSLLECMADIGLGTYTEEDSSSDAEQRNTTRKQNALYEDAMRHVALGDGWRYIADAVALAHCLLHRIQLCAHWMGELLGGDATCRPQLQALVQRLRTLLQALPLRYARQVRRDTSKEALRGIDALVQSTLQLSVVALRTCASSPDTKAAAVAASEAVTAQQSVNAEDAAAVSLPLFCCRLPAAELRYCCSARGVVRQWRLLADTLALCYLTLCTQAVVRRHAPSETERWTAAAHVMQHLQSLGLYMTQPARLRCCTSWLMRSSTSNITEDDAALGLDAREGAASVAASMESELATAVPLPLQVRVLESALAGVLEDVTVLAGFTRTLLHLGQDSSTGDVVAGGVLASLTSRPLAQTSLVRLASKALQQEEQGKRDETGQDKEQLSAAQADILDQPFALLATLYVALQDEPAPRHTVDIAPFSSLGTAQAVSSDAALFSSSSSLYVAHCGDVSEAEAETARAVVEAVRSSAVRSVLKLVQGYGEDTSGVAWRHILRLLHAVVDRGSEGTTTCSNSGKSRAGAAAAAALAASGVLPSVVRDRINTAFRVLEAVQHNYITSLDLAGMTQLIRGVGSFVTHQVPSAETQDHRLHIHLSAVQLLWSIADYLASNPIASTTDKSNSGGGGAVLRGDDAQSGLWCALLQELMRGCVDERQEIRQGALKTLLALVQTHGPRFTAQSWRCLLREALVPLMVLIQRGVARCAQLPPVPNARNADTAARTVNAEVRDAQYAELLRLDVEDVTTIDEQEERKEDGDAEKYGRELQRKTAALLDIFAAQPGQLEEMRLTLMDAGSRILFTHYVTLHTTLTAGSDAYLLEQVLSSFVSLCGATRVVVRGSSGEASALAAVQALHGLLVEVPGGLSTQLIMRVWQALLGLLLQREEHALAHTAAKQCTQAVLSALLEALCDDFMMRYGQSADNMTNGLPHQSLHGNKTRSTQGNAQQQQQQQQQQQAAASSSSSFWSLWQRGSTEAAKTGNDAAANSSSTSESTSSDTGAHTYREMYTSLRAFCFAAMVRVLCASAQSTAVVQSYYYPNKVQRTWLEGVRALWPVLVPQEAHTLLHTVLLSQLPTQQDIEAFLIRNSNNDNIKGEGKAGHEGVTTLRAALPPGAHPDFLQLLVQLLHDFLLITGSAGAAGDSSRGDDSVQGEHTLAAELIRAGLARTSTLLCLQYAPGELLSPHSPTSAAAAAGSNTSYVAASTSFSVSDDLFVQCMGFIEDAVQLVLSHNALPLASGNRPQQMQHDRDAALRVFCEAVAAQLRMANTLLPGQPAGDDNNSTTKQQQQQASHDAITTSADEGMAGTSIAPRIARLLRLIDMLEEIMQQLLMHMNTAHHSSSGNEDGVMGTMTLIEDHIVPVLVSGSMSNATPQLQPVAQRSLAILERWAAVPVAATTTTTTTSTATNNNNNNNSGDGSAESVMGAQLARLQRRITLSLQTRSLSIFEAYAAAPQDAQAATALCDTLRSLLASCEALARERTATNSAGRVLSDSQRRELRQMLPALTRLVGCTDVRAVRTAAEVTSEQSVRALLAQTLAALHTLLVAAQ